jgi:hypothetical protein
MLVTEIMYHPAPPPLGSTFDTEDFEFIELMNNGNVALELKVFDSSTAWNSRFRPTR